MFRRRIAPLAFGLAIVLMARESCNKHERAHATIVLDFGAAQPEVRTVEAQLWMNGDEIADFRRNALDGSSIGTVKFDAVLPASDGQLRIDIDLAHAPHQHLVRDIHATDGATVIVPLGDALK